MHVNPNRNERTINPFCRIWLINLPVCVSYTVMTGELLATATRCPVAEIDRSLQAAARSQRLVSFPVASWIDRRLPVAAWKKHFANQRVFLLSNKSREDIRHSTCRLVPRRRATLPKEARARHRLDSRHDNNFPLAWHGQSRQSCTVDKECWKVVSRCGKRAVREDERGRAKD